MCHHPHACSHKRPLQICLRGNKRITFHSPPTTHILHCSHPPPPLPDNISAFFFSVINVCMLLSPPLPNSQKDSLGNATATCCGVSRPQPEGHSAAQPTSGLRDYKIQAELPLVRSESGTGLKKESKWLVGQQQTVNPKRPGNIVFHVRLSWQVLTGPRWQTGCSPALSLHRLTPSCVSITILQNRG